MGRVKRNFNVIKKIKAMLKFAKSNSLPNIVMKYGKHVPEQPLFTTKAHVFQIDPKTKQKWLPASTQAINVSYYFDTNRTCYRIISVEGSKAVINSTITPNMTFTKTSQKFGQWSDPRANTVYGLGFSSETELSKFIEKFKEVKDLTRKLNQKSLDELDDSIGNPDSNHIAFSDKMSESEGSKSIDNEKSQHSDTSDMDGDKQMTPKSDRRSPGSLSTTSLPSNSDNALKYENDRLKLALSQSSANAKKWEIELTTLKNNNSRLTAALQESTSNVEEWKKQLSAYKEECEKLKQKVAVLEEGQAQNDGNEELEVQLSQVEERLGRSEADSRKKDEEIKHLKGRIDELFPLESENQLQCDRIKVLEKENKLLKSEMKDIQLSVQSVATKHDQEKSELLNLQQQVGNKLTELYELHDQISSSLQS